MPLVDHNKQKQFWETKAGRRGPDHLAVQAYARPKVNLIAKKILPTGDTPLTMLEVGCGNGFFSQELTNHFDLTCLDFSKNMLELHPFPWEQKVVGNAENLEFDNNSFDVVCCTNLLHHLENPMVAVKEMKRVAKHHVVLIEPNAINPLMFMFCLIRPEERGALKFTSTYLRNLGRAAQMELRHQCAQGAVVPNKTPLALLPLMRLFDWRWPLGLYLLAIFDA